MAVLSISKKSVSDLSRNDLANKVALVRVDFNVPLNSGAVVDDGRIRAAIPTIKHLSNNGAIVVLMSHLGRPKGERNADYSLRPASARLSELIGAPVAQLDDCVGADVQSAISTAKPGDVIMLENLRFYSEETANDDGFSQQLAQLADLYVNDSFGTAHRAHASTAGVAAHLPAYAGFLIEKELTFLENAVQSPDRPFVAIIGGSKVSTKLGCLENMLGKVDTLVIVGAMVFTFLKAQGYSVGKSLMEPEYLDQATAFLTAAESSPTNVLIPVDQVVVTDVAPDAETRIVASTAIPEDAIGVDAGPLAVEEISTALRSAKTVLWNGPLGIFEIPAFATGTNAIAQVLAEIDATTIVGGGDSAAAIKQSGHADAISHISTGGGASLEFLEGKALPSIAVLEDR